MPHFTSRRQFLRAAVATPALGLTDLSSFLPFGPASAAAADIKPDMVRFDRDIEPVVKLLEETPAEKSVEVAVGLLRDGLPYRRLLTAVFLAAIRSGTGHDVYVVHSAHQLSLDAQPEERLLPVLWAVNNVAGTRLRDDREIRLRPLGGPFPWAEKARDEFHAAMDRLDVEGAERAVVVLARSHGAHAVFNELWPYGALNCQSVYHSSISLANGWRTLETVGWRHAEPMLRFFVHDCIRASPKAKLVHRNDWTYAGNRERVRQWAGKLAADWAGGGRDTGLTRELLALLREHKADDACELAVRRLAEGKAQAGAVWDAVHLAAGELLMRRQDAAYPIHVNTGANALRYGFRTSGDPSTRLLLLLQGLGWQCHARRRLGEVAAADPRQKLGDAKIDELAAAEIPDRLEEAAKEVFATRNAEQDKAARRVFALAGTEAGVEVYRRAAYRLLFTRLKSTYFPNGDVHDFKFPPAIFEDAALVDEKWRPHLMAASVYWLPGSDSPESPVFKRAREAVRKL